jgi:N-methylhydantoinase B/oxoprolinase/acetone carboxylase alpha subunit
LVDTGERFLVQTAGGGYAEARLRELAAIDRDVAEGRVSASSREAAAPMSGDERLQSEGHPYVTTTIAVA